jgi:hypothetical protein
MVDQDELDLGGADAFAAAVVSVERPDAGGGDIPWLRRRCPSARPEVQLQSWHAIALGGRPYWRGARFKGTASQGKGGCG